MRSQLEALSRQRQALVTSLERVIAGKPVIISTPLRTAFVSAVPKHIHPEMVDVCSSNGLNGMEPSSASGDGQIPRAESTAREADPDDAVDPAECARCVDWSKKLPCGFRRRLVRTVAPVGACSTIPPPVGAPPHSTHRFAFGMADSKKRRRAAENNLLAR